MAFQLTISSKREPSGSGERATSAASHFTTIEVRGNCGRDDVRGLLRTISEAFDEGADTVLIDAFDVSADDPESFPIFTQGLMAIRDAGRDVQMRVRDAAQHERLAALPKSRDWLLTFDATSEGVRKSLHLDGVPRHVPFSPDPE